MYINLAIMNIPYPEIVVEPYQKKEFLFFLACYMAATEFLNYEDEGFFHKEDVREDDIGYMPYYGMLKGDIYENILNNMQFDYYGYIDQMTQDEHFKVMEHIKYVRLSLDLSGYNTIHIEGSLLLFINHGSIYEYFWKQRNIKIVCNQHNKNNELRTALEKEEERLCPS